MQSNATSADKDYQDYRAANSMPAKTVKMKKQSAYRGPFNSGNIPLAANRTITINQTTSHYQLSRPDGATNNNYNQLDPPMMGKSQSMLSQTHS